MARAHHGWGGFDQDRPIYLEGKAGTRHLEEPACRADAALTPGLALPADLAKRALPAQSASVDARAHPLPRPGCRRAQDPVWELELAPLTRMEAWKVAEIKPGQQVAAIGYTFPGEKGEAVLRVEYLFADGKAYGLRSSPA